jgi:hypothetical protein
MQTVTDLADPRRCKAGTATGQCLAVAADGSDYCVAHHGVDRGQGRRMRKYLLATAEDQGLLAKYADDDELKSLREEIGLTRVMIQNTMAGALSEVEKINAYAKVNGYLLTLEKLMKTCHTLDQSMGNLIGKPALRRLGRELAQVVVDRLEGVANYESIVESVLCDFARIIDEIDNGTPEPAARE